MGVQRRPQRTPYPQEESLQHLAVDHITGVNASRGPIHSHPCATPGPAPGHPAMSHTERKPHKVARGKKQAWAGTPPLSTVFAPGPC